MLLTKNKRSNRCTDDRRCQHSINDKKFKVVKVVNACNFYKPVANNFVVVRNIPENYV